MIIVGVLIIVAAIACSCVKLIRFRGLGATVPLPDAGLKIVQDYKIDDRIILEKFLQDLATEKPISFTAEELTSFTSNYSTKLGSGGFGVVYKGQFPNGVKIAVKILSSCLNKKMKAQFMTEVGTFSRTDHINLVKLYGFCNDHMMAALVYEYMEKGSLDKYLFTEKEEIKWEKLHDIAIGTAKGIAYLHEEYEQRIIHYDIKPGNVLLDAKLSAKVADFGLARLCNPDNPNDSTSEYRGTPGYSAPEFYLREYPITHKCDVYSFGMLLFEIVGRRNNAQDSSSDNLNWFPKQVWEEYARGELAAMIESCGIEEKQRDKAERMCMVALWCAQDSPEARPPMSAVVKMLEGGVAIAPPPKPFLYLDSIGMEALKSPCNYKFVSNISSSHFDTSKGSARGVDSSGHKGSSTPIMTKYGIRLAMSPSPKYLDYVI